MKIKLLLMSACALCIAQISFSQVILNNNFQDIDVGGTGVTISYYPSGSNGKSVGDVVLYEDVANISGTAVDLYVTTVSINNGSMSYFDNSATSGPSMSNNEARFFSPQFNFSSGGGYAQFDFQFIEGGTFSYNTSTKVASGTNVILLNVSINTYDIDGNGGVGSEQYNEFGGFYSSTLGSSTTLNGTYSTNSNLSRFESTTTTQVTNVLADQTRVQVNYDSISDFSIVVGAGASGYAYFYLDFGSGPAWSSTPVEYYQVTGSVFDDGDGLTNSKVDGIKFDNPDNNQLYVHLIDKSTNKIVKREEVIDDGNFTFTAVADGDYFIVLNTMLFSIGASAPGADIPTDWVHTGEFLGNLTGNDGTADGEISLTVSGGSVGEARIAIDKRPDADSYSYSIADPVYGSYLSYGQSGSTTSILTGEDYEDGSYGAGDYIAITSLPTNGNDLYYNGVQITTGQDGSTPPSDVNPYIISNYVPSYLAVRFVGVGSSSTTIEYVVYDEAGYVDLTPATYVLDWGTPLPVKFVYIDVVLDLDMNVDVRWATDLEVNSSRFEIERKIDDGLFMTIDMIEAAGNSNDLKTYNYIDRTLPVGVNEAFYRIKQLDFDNTASYSEVKSLKFKNNVKTSMYPNPATSEVTITLNDLRDHGKIEIYDMLGEVVHKQSVHGTSTVSIDELSNGIYLVFLYTEKGTEMQRLQVKERN